MTINHKPENTTTANEAHPSLGKRFTKTVDIWALNDEQIKNLLPGQWVSAGPDGNKGRFYGVKESGSIVVAWQYNAKNSGNATNYNKVIRAYANNKQTRGY